MFIYFYLPNHSDDNNNNHNHNQEPRTSAGAAVVCVLLYKHIETLHLNYIPTYPKHQEQLLT